MAGFQLSINGRFWVSTEDPYEAFGQAEGLDRPSKDPSRISPAGADFGVLLYAEVSGIAADTVKNASEHLYVNSWCLGHESIGLWDLYGANGCGVAIKSTVGRFKRALKREVRPEQYEFGKVTYHLDLRSAPNIGHDFTSGSVPASSRLWKIALQLGFNKRVAYEHEREWRAVIFQEQRRPETGIDIPTDLELLISEVWVGPRADELMMKAVAAVMQRVELRKPLEQSAILRRP